MDLKTRVRPFPKGFSLTEVIVAVGILGLTLLTLLTLCSIALKYHRQSLNNATAVRVNDMVLERAVAGVIHDTPSGEADKFWGNQYPYPSTSYREGVEKVGRESFNYAIYAVDIPGLGDSSTTPPNVLRRVDAYVWWTEEGEPGGKRTHSTRLLNRGEEP